MKRPRTDFNTAIAQARRYFHHVHHGGRLKPSDVSHIVSAMEKMQQTISFLEEKLANTLEELESTHG